MTFVLNSSDIEDAQYRAAEEVARPNLQAAVLTLARLHDWVQSNSDGWAYWKKPAAASTKLQNLTYSRYFGRFDSRIEEDLTARELKSAYTPIKAFLTRQGVAHSVIFPND